ncbi:MAG TPA: enoyl-CoA hydratase [Burkholderiales bacterium]|nr:enoyl-CoA hydratase [Burkholderiales bacterium]
MEIITEVKDGILRIQMNRPEKKNALTVAMYAEMATAFEQAERDSAIRVVLIHGCSDVFTSGNDLQDFMKNPPAGEESPVFKFLVAISTAAKPVIAAVNGPAVGIGVTMLLHCDLVYAAETTRFQLPFVNLALVPEAGSSLLLPNLIGYRRAAELLLLGEAFSAVKAHEYGLISEVTGDGEELAAAMATAKKLAGKPPAALRLTKMLMKKNGADLVARHMGEEAVHFVRQLQSPEAQEAFKAFQEKRPPDYSKFN